MNCPKCQKPIPEDSLVCGYCGQAIEPQEQSDAMNEAVPAGEGGTGPVSEIQPAEDAEAAEPGTPAAGPEPFEPAAEPEDGDSPAGGAAEREAPCAQADAGENRRLSAGSDPAEPAALEAAPAPAFSEESSAPVNPAAEAAAVPAEPAATEAATEAHPQEEEKAAKREKKIEAAYVRRMAKRQRPIRTAGFFWTEFLLLIPGVNLALLFVWAFRKNANANRKAFARSILIWLIVLVVFLLVVFIVMLVLGIPVDKYVWLQYFKDWAAGLAV